MEMVQQLTLQVDQIQLQPQSYQQSHQIQEMRQQQSQPDIQNLLLRQPRGGKHNPVEFARSVDSTFKLCGLNDTLGKYDLEIVINEIIIADMAGAMTWGSRKLILAGSQEQNHPTLESKEGYATVFNS